MRSLAQHLKELNTSTVHLPKTALRFSEIGISNDALRLELPSMGFNVYLEPDDALIITPSTPHGPGPATPTDNVGRTYGKIKADGNKLEEFSKQLYDLAVLGYFLKALDPYNAEKINAISKIAASHDKLVKKSCLNLKSNLNEQQLGEIKKQAETRYMQRLKLLKKSFNDNGMALPEGFGLLHK